MFAEVILYDDSLKEIDHKFGKVYSQESTTSYDYGENDEHDGERTSVFELCMDDSE